MASEIDIKKVFWVYGLKSNIGSFKEDDILEGQINAMQFSTIWRKITGEKGNLFKEMQMFKK
jgi:hypothetical protein